MFTPRLFQILKGPYSKTQLIKDLSAGLVVGIVAIPLAVAFAIASGVSPDKGLLTAVIAGFLISLLGGSDVQIGGPTGAFIVIVYGIVSKFGFDGLVLATLMAGVILLAMGYGRLGSVIQFIPYPVIIGFTSGIAVIIFSSQVNDILGLGLLNLPGEFLGKWEQIIIHGAQVNWWALGISLVTIVVMVVLGLINKGLPAALVALIITTVLVHLLGLPVETIGSRFGEISGAIPVPRFPTVSFARLQELLMPAISIALLGGIESLLSAVVADRAISRKHDSNTELVAQGYANIASALFGGIPATGAIARTMTNIRSGGRSPVAGVVHAIFLLGVLLFLSPLTGLIPMATLAGILTMVAYNMSEHHTFRSLLKGPRGDILALVLTFLLTVLMDLTIAIPVGILLAFFSFLGKMSAHTRVVVHRGSYRGGDQDLDPFGLTALALPDQVDVLEIEGPLFFGTAERLKNELVQVDSNPQVRILLMPKVPTLDASGARVLRDLLEDALEKKTKVIFVGLQPSVRGVFERIGLSRLVGPNNLVSDIMAALDLARLAMGHGEPSMGQKLKAGGLLRGMHGQGPEDIIRSSVAHFPLSSSLQEALLHSILERETLAPTALGRGFAFPHPRQPILSDPGQEFIFIVYLDSGVPWPGPDGPVVNTVVFMVSANVQDHLRTLAKFTKLTGNKEFMALIEARAELETLVQWMDGD